MLTCAFMFPEPPTDRRHPWLWTLLPGSSSAASAGAEGGEPHAFRTQQLHPSLCVDGDGAGPSGGDGWVCWNVSGALRWFEPVVLNLAKDKQALFAPP